MTARAPATLYRGHVMHMRLIPRRHRFRYRVFSVLVDIDRMAETLRPLRLITHNTPGVLSVKDRDHGPRDGTPLRPWVDAQLARAGRPGAARVEMLSFPRMFGYGFNPLTVYYCLDDGDALTSVIYEVKNTFGDQIAYTVPAGAAEGGAYRQRQGKAMYVSPFIAMDQTYRFTLDLPGQRMGVRIRQAGPGGDTLIATHTGRGERLTDAGLARALVLYPLLSFRVIALIHWHAARLFLKGVPFLRAPRPSKKAVPGR